MTTMASDNPRAKAWSAKLSAAVRRVEQELERRDAKEQARIDACTDPALKADLIRQREEAEHDAFCDTSVAMCSLQLAANIGAAQARQVMRRRR